jgi:glutamyl-tRNA(Gln) amidotransferase subunit E
MYPETDIPTTAVSSSMWQSVLENMPMTDSERQERLSKYDISGDQSEQLLARELDDSFVDYQNDLPAKAWATVLLENDEVDPALSSLVLLAKEQGELTREAINDVITNFANTGATMAEIQSFAEQNGLKPADTSSLQSVIDAVVLERIDFVKERGMGAIGPLMGVVMQKAGAADGKAVSALLKQAIMDATK